MNVFNIEIFYVIISKVGNFIFMKLIDLKLGSQETLKFFHRAST